MLLLLATKSSGCPQTLRLMPWGLNLSIQINWESLKADNLPAKYESTGRCWQVWITLLPGLPGTPGGPGLPLGPSRGGPGNPGGPGGPCRPGNPWKPGSPFRPGSPGGPGGPGNPSSPFCPVKPNSHVYEYRYNLICKKVQISVYRAISLSCRRYKSGHNSPHLHSETV